MHRCFRHRWLNVKVRHVRDVSLGEPGCMRTDVYRRCTQCGKPKVKSLKGTWELADLAPRPAEGGDG